MPRRYTVIKVEVLRLASLALALAGLVAVWLEPRLERESTQPVFESIEVVALLDITDSMRAPISASDPAPRFEVMIDAADHILSQFRDDRRAIAAFTTALLHWTPMTRDYERLVRPDIERLRNQRVFAEYGFGTNFAAAIRGCVFLFEQVESQRICLLLTDGEPEGDLEQLTQDLVEALQEVAEVRQERDITFFMIGIGDPASAQPIPVFNPEDPDTFVGYRALESGERILTRPDHRYLDQMARSLDGTFFSIDDQAALDDFIDEILGIERAVIDQRRITHNHDLSAPFLVLTLLATFAFWWQTPGFGSRSS